MFNHLEDTGDAQILRGKQKRGECNMKKYEPEALVASSRYRVYFPTLPVEIQRDVYSRMRVLLEEEKRWCDKGNYMI